MELKIKPLNPSTWDDFELLAGKHNGVWGGCWCVWFHQSDTVKMQDPESNKKLKKSLVISGKAHAALVYDGANPVAWCQYGAPDELPHIYHKKEVESEGYVMPDWRITCIYVDNKYRKRGVAKAAVLGAVELIKNEGGGVVEAYPQDTEGKKVSSSFLYNGTKTLFEECGFEFAGAKGKNHTIMKKLVQPDLRQ